MSPGKTELAGYLDSCPMLIPFGEPKRRGYVGSHSILEIDTDKKISEYTVNHWEASP